MSGLHTIQRRRLTGGSPELRHAQYVCLILTSYDDQDAVLASVLAGASGYVLKEVRTSGLADPIPQVALGRSLIDPALIAQVVDRVRTGTKKDDRLAGLTARASAKLGMERRTQAAVFGAEVRRDE